MKGWPYWNASCNRVKPMTFAGGTASGDAENGYRGGLPIAVIERLLPVETGRQGRPRKRNLSRVRKKT
jgi:hypothetical protein